MATKNLYTSIIPLFIILFLSPSLAYNSSFSPYSSCNLTPHPSFCSTTLTPDHLSIHDQCLFFLYKSLTITKTILDSISSYLIDQSMIIPKSTAHALEDCLILAELNIDFLSSVLQSIDSTGTTGYQAYDLQTLLSAILTNQQTCLDGFNEVAPYPIINSALLNALSDGCKLYSISLALFTHGWVNGIATGRSTTITTKNRKLLQTNIDNVMVREKVVVNPDGSGDFTTINDAVDAAPNNISIDNGYHVIYVVAGVYNEYVSVGKSKQNLMIVGDGINQTVITGNHSVVDGWTTFQSATFAVLGKGFVAVNITFRNNAGSSKHQAVAVRNSADMSTFYNCSFEGYQDTLYAHSLRQFYKNCHIYGTVDFIFGNAAAVFQDCNMYPKLPMQNQFNAITAQGRTDPNQNTGISIQNSWIIPASDLTDSSTATTSNNNYSDIVAIKTYLGRPWKEYSRTIYMKCFMDGLIDPKGWVEWSGEFALRTLYYAEFANWGPGSNYTNRVTWEGYHRVDQNGVDDFSVYKFIQGDTWLPKTGVPFKAGLQ